MIFIVRSRRFFPGTVLWLVASLLAAGPGAAEEPSSRIVFSHLDSSDGFKAGTVTAMAEDDRAAIWLGTDQGLNRFDGAETMEFKHDPANPDTVSSNRITSLVMGPGGVLWVGTADAGVNRIDTKTRKAELLKRRHGVPGDWLRCGQITSLGITKNQFLWIGTEKGLDVYHLVTGKLRNDTGIPDGAHVTRIFVESDESIWVGTEDGRAFHSNPDCSTFTPVWSTGVPISAIARASPTELWVGTRGQGLLKLDLPSGQAAPSELSSRDITTVRTDSNGDLWVGATDGLARLQRGGTDFDRYHHHPEEPTSISSDHVSALFESRSKILWAGTSGGGANRFDLNRYWFPHYQAEKDRAGRDGLPHNSIWSIAPAAENMVWIGAEAGLALWNPKTATCRTPDLGEAIGSPVVSTICETGAGDVWAGTKGNGLLFLRGGDGGRAVNFRHADGDPRSIGHDSISALLEDGDSHLWIGTHGAGLWRLGESGTDFSPIPVKTTGGAQEKSEPTNPGFITSLTEATGGRLWIGATDGLYVTDPSRASLLPYREALPGAPPLSSESIVSVLAVAGDILYIGTAGAGLNQLHTKTGAVRVYKRENCDLPSNEILGLVDDGQGRVWISTPKGIVRFSPPAEQFRIFDDRDGLQKGTFHANAAARGADGALYFGGEGFHRIDLDSLPLPHQPPTPILTDLEMFGESVVPRHGGILEKSIAATSEIRMPYDRRNRFAFRFANLDADHPHRGYFRYRLTGFEDTWQNADLERRASYAAVPPGKYEFQVESSPDSHDWNANRARVTLSIIPPWWQTWWARTAFGLLALIAVGGLGGALKRSQIRRIRRREEMLKSQRDKAEAQLAIQLQNAILLERSAFSFADDIHKDDIFREPLENLARHFGFHRSLLFSLDETGDGTRLLTGIGEYGPGDACSLLHHAIPVNDPVIVEILDSKEPVQRENMLALRTCFQGVPNGVLLLKDCDPAHREASEEIRLLQSVAGQYGIAVAQRNLTIKEDGYRRQLELARRQADSANQAKSAFLARMTHELRTPLSAIIGFTQLFREDGTLKKNQRELINIISDSGEHLLDVINDILDVSKIEAGKAEVHPERFQIQPFLRSIQELLKGKLESKNLAFGIISPPALPALIETDRGKLRQILVNLFGNAIKFTDHGSIRLQVAAETAPATFLRDGEERRQVRLHFQVSDTGCGIPDKDLPRLFDAFSQSENGKLASESTGLGLTIVKGLIKLLGGEIAVRSELGSGTTFLFHILCEEIVGAGQTTAAEPGPSPAAAAAGESPARAITGLAAGSPEVRILIAEDRPVNRLLLKKVLSRAGFDLVEAVDGREAVEKWRETSPDLILMDEDMPEMSGVEATRFILGECGEGEEPVIIQLTAHAFEQAREAALAAGCRDFLSKPFKNEDLFAMIAEHLDLTYAYADDPAPSEAVGTP